MVYYDLTDITTSPREALPRQLSKGDALHLAVVKPELARVPVSRAHVRELREIVGL
jgi:hypothetical protein